MDKVFKITFPDESLSISKFQRRNYFIFFLLISRVTQRLEAVLRQPEHVVKEARQVLHFIALAKIHAFGVISLNQAVANLFEAVERAGELVGKENGEQRYLHDDEENADAKHPKQRPQHGLLVFLVRGKIPDVIPYPFDQFGVLGGRGLLLVLELGGRPVFNFLLDYLGGRRDDALGGDIEGKKKKHEHHQHGQ